MTPLVSILMPVFKTAPYLREAVDSILSQSFTDFELIVLNDCSPDNAEEILDSYNDPRIVRYKGKHNVGLGNVLNVGIGMARGKYIARMDSDDISLPNRLRVQVDFLNTHPEFGFVSVGMKEFGDGERVYSYDNESEKIKFVALFYSPVLHASSMWRKNSFEGLFYKQAFVPSEDYELWTRALLKGVRMRNLPEVLYMYRRFPGQSASANNGEKHREAKLLYIKNAFTGIDDDLAMQWSRSLENSNNPEQLKETLSEMSAYNRQLPFPFFDVRLFDSNSKRLYQALLFKKLMEGGRGPVSDLRMRQIVKLYYHKFFHRIRR